MNDREALAYQKLQDDRNLRNAAIDYACRVSVDKKTLLAVANEIYKFLKGKAK